MTIWLKSKTTDIQAPPWLWVWIVLFVLSVPDWFSHFRGSMRALLAIEGAMPDYGSPFVRLVLTPTFLEVLPTAVLTLGIVILLIPWLRALLIERRDHLSEMPVDYPSPIILEIGDFIRQHVPHAKIKVRLANSKRLASVYPASFHHDVIVIFGGLVRIWRLNRAEGEAILLHELAHHQRRDAIIVGVGSPLVYIVRFWVPISILLALSIWCIEVIQAINNQQLANQSGIWNTIWELTGQFVTVVLPGFTPIIVAVLIWTIAIFIVPIFGIWCAELSADRFAISREESHGAFVGWLSRQRDSKGITDWAFRRIAHPPMALRLWMARNQEHWFSLVFLLLLFPSAYLIRFIFLIGWGLIAHILGGSPSDQLIEEIPMWTDSYFRSLESTYAIFGVVLIVWPWIGTLLRYLTKRTSSVYKVDRYKIYAIIGVVLCTPILFGSYSSNSCRKSNIVLTTDKMIYRAGEAINVEYT